MQFKRNLSKIHILGKGPTWVNCPGREEKYEVEGEEIWTLNSMFNHHVSVDRIFLMHDPRQELIYEDRNYFLNIREYGKPVYSTKKYEVLGELNAAYPIDYVLSHFPIVYYTNAICWMLALAILLEPDEIVLHGVDMRIAVEYANERGGTEFWVGVATGKGIKVTIPDGSAICSTNSVWGPTYGYIPIFSNGMLVDWEPDYRGFYRPEVLERYRLLPVTEPYRKPLEEIEALGTD